MTQHNESQKELDAAIELSVLVHNLSKERGTGLLTRISDLSLDLISLITNPEVFLDDQGRKIPASQILSELRALLDVLSQVNDFPRPQASQINALFRVSTRSLADG
jgi:hypothetical protein